MKILFLGSVTSQELSELLSGSSVAGNKMQISLLQGLKALPGIEINALSSLSVAAFPYDKRLRVRCESHKVSEGINTTLIPFFNIPLLKQACQMAGFFWLARAAVKKDPRTIIISFNLFPQQGLPAFLLQKLYRCKLVAIMADYPIDDRPNKNVIRILLRAVFDAMTRFFINECRNQIVMNKRSIEAFAPLAKYIVIEGGVELPAEKAFETLKAPLIRNVLFSGALTAYNGIVELLDAVPHVKHEDIEFHVYGAGPLEDVVREAAEKDRRLRFFGSIPNNEMLQRQREAWLLISPRRIDDPISAFTFPSKIFEYMLSGVPVLATRLSCFDERFEGKMLFIENGDGRGIAESIDCIARLQEEIRSGIAKSARQFIQEQMTWQAQCRKIATFLSMVENE